MSRLLFALAAVGFLLAGSARGEDAKFVKLVNPDTGKVLAVADNSDDAGAKVVAAKDDGSDGQQWKVEKDGDFLKITNRKSGKVLDVFEANKEEGADIIQWDDKGDDNDNQRWSWVDTSAAEKAKSRRLKSKLSDLVLEIGENGKVTQKKADDKSKAQLWEVAAVKK